MFKVKMRIEKETKNAVRYQEVIDGDGTEKIGTLYIKKASFDGKAPETITVEVSA